MKHTVIKPKRRYFVRDVMIKPRTPKWERQFLEKKQAEEYIAIHASERHHIVKKYHKSKHFLKWAIKLIVPDFLIGHPNLWDNLKTLRKHPQFKPMRMALIAWLFFTLTIGSVGIYSIKNASRILADSPATDTFTDQTKIATSTNITVDTGAGQIKLSVAPWSCGDTLTDSRDSKTYDTVQIGDQCWMAENLNVGTLTTSSNDMSDDSTIEKFCFNDLESNCTLGGGLYEWNETMDYAASSDTNPSGVQGICPTDWHVPSHSEWTELTDYLGANAGSQIKQAGTCGDYGCFTSGNTDATNSSGFTALATGNINPSNISGNSGTLGMFWTSTTNGASAAWRRYIRNSETVVTADQGQSHSNGYSVRCVKD